MSLQDILTPAVKEAIKKIQYLIDAYKVEAIAIGNGTAGRQTETGRNDPWQDTPPLR